LRSQENYNLTILSRIMKIFVALIKIISAFLFPPMSVFLQVRFRINFWINILLTLIGWIPGVIHAILVISFINQNNNPQLIKNKSQQLRWEEEIEDWDWYEPNIKQTPEEIAKRWLINLDQNSDEYIWFETFSERYKSKLEAAIDYLQTMRETPCT
jgi:uncharacterized membrane protein YqaE (UPF0057 family)